jgi:hypothetical protein
VVVDSPFDAAEQEEEMLGSLNPSVVEEENV